MTGTESKYKLDKAQTVKAVKALQAFMAKNKENCAAKPDLLADDDSGSEDDSSNAHDNAADPDMAVWLQVSTVKHVTDQRKLKPHRLTLPHPMLKITPTIAICIIVKDPPAAFKALVPKLGLPATATLKITSPASLRGKYKSFESRRQLERAHDVFLADNRIIPVLPKILGKSIYKRASKIPIPIDIEKKEKDAEKFKHEIEKAIGATYLHLSPSNCHSIRVGTRTMKAEDVADNVSAVVDQVTEKHVPRGWKGVRSLFVKFATTAALPVWEAEKIYDPEQDVLAPEEIKAIEFKKSEEGQKQMKKEKAEKKKQRKVVNAERKKNKRNWDSDVEEEEQAPKQLEAPSKKRKLAQANGKAAPAPAPPADEKPAAKKDASTTAKANPDKKVLPPMPMKKRKVELEKKLKRTSLGGSESTAKKQKKSKAKP